MSTTNKTRTKIIAIFILAIFCVLMVWPYVPAGTPFKNFWDKAQFRLGLDLQGGTHLVYSADTSKIDEADKSSAVEGVRDVIERRVNAFGVSEPVVQTNITGDDYRIIVELAGVHDVNQAIQMIGETPLLEFKEQDPNFKENLSAEDLKQLEEENNAIKQKAGEVLKRALAGEDFASLATEYSEDIGSASQGGDLGFVKRGMFVPEFEETIFDKMSVPGIYPELVQTEYGYHIIKKIEERGESDNYEVHSAHILFLTKSEANLQSEAQWINTNLSGKHLKRSQVTFDQQTNEPRVSLEFNNEGKELFAEITSRNIGKPVAIFLDNIPISVPTVQDAIKEGKAIITGRFNVKEAKELVQRLNAGALPVPIELISQQTVGASLGKQSIDKSLIAGLIGIIAVAVFMLLYYRLPGLLAVIALAIYIASVLTIFKVASITLTLAGVAGFVLSVGMAVDANVLIFERLKEELKAGRELSSAIQEGFKRAWSSIWDSNISTILTCLILIWFGTSVIKGFAITLFIGVLVSMFSAIVITKSFLTVFGRVKNRWVFGIRNKE